jgi:hypothetical protein
VGRMYTPTACDLGSVQKGIKGRYLLEVLNFEYATFIRGF